MYEDERRGAWSHGKSSQGYGVRDDGWVAALFNDVAGPRVTMSLHDTLFGDQPPHSLLEILEHERPNAGPSGGFSGAGTASQCPTKRPEIVADGEVDIHDHR